MTTRTPPGWYPDPGHAGVGPAPERWWDGEHWSDHTRTTGLPPVPPPPMPPPGGSSRGPLIAGISVAVVLVAALVAGGVLIATGGSDGSDKAGGPHASNSPQPSPRSSKQPDDGQKLPGGPEAGTPGSAARGVVLPVPEGWQRQGKTIGAGPYKCPADKKLQCLRGGADIVVAALPSAHDAEMIAREDIKAYAQTSYGKQAYGGITGHKVAESGPVTVAGQDGYRVLWKIENTVGPDAYVESVAFPHPDGSGQMLVANLSVDIAEGAPPKSDLDDIIAGIEKGSPPDDGNSKPV